MSGVASLTWHREGLVLTVPPSHSVWKTHAQVPTVLPLASGLWRIFLCGRDDGNRSHILAVDVDPDDRMRIVAEHFTPWLSLGRPGTFDHSGMGISSIVTIDGQAHAYYTGVSLRRDVPAQTAVGVATGCEGSALSRVFEGPVRGPGPHDPLATLAAHVLPWGGGYRMWYVSATGWRDTAEGQDILYGIRTCASADGLHWDNHTTAIVDLRDGLDGGAGRPFVARTAEGPRLWFSRRGLDFRRAGAGAYSLFSVALDPGGTVAEGEPVPVIFDNPPGDSDFDSWSQAYSCILPYGDDLIMVYNGNDFGRHGFGWARCAGGARYWR